MITATVTFRWDNSEGYLNFNNQGVEINIGGKSTVIDFSVLVSLKIDLKKKLAPLVGGAVLASLALVNILLEGASLTMMGVLSFGLLTLYFGLTEYWVITIEQFKESKSFWISKNKCQMFPKALVNIINFRILNGFFPPLYTLVNRADFSKIIGHRKRVAKLTKPLKYFLTPPKPSAETLLLKVDLSQFCTQLNFVLNQDYLAIGAYQINKDALLNIEL